jgi:hypothetical protein
MSSYTADDYRNAVCVAAYRCAKAELPDSEPLARTELANIIERESLDAAHVARCAVMDVAELQNSGNGPTDWKAIARALAAEYADVHISCDECARRCEGGRTGGHIGQCAEDILTRVQRTIGGGTVPDAQAKQSTQEEKS